MISADARRTARHYLKTLFFIDLVADVPLDALFLGGEDIRVAGLSLALILRQLRLLRVARLFVVFRRWQGLTWTNAGYLRIAKFFTIVMLLVHWIACAWFLVPHLEGFPENCWVVQQGIERAGSTTPYIRSLYWVIQTMARWRSSRRTERKPTRPWRTAIILRIFPLILKERPSASVKALTYCEVFILTKKDFNQIRNEYPEFREVLKKVSSEKTEMVVNLLLKGVTL